MLGGAAIEDLLQRALSGDRSAEGALFERLHARILVVAVKRLRDPERGRDLAQDVIRTALEKYRGADLSHGFLPWAFTILHHKVGNYLKHHRVTARHEGGSVEALDWSTLGVAAREESGGFELRELLAKALRALSAECRRVFRLLLDDADREEIRQAFGGEPLGTTYSRISRCRDRLLAAMQELTR